jgi:mannose/fructose/N-acetylgalactosamine-specific phosphotransferase system component IIB
MYYVVKVSVLHTDLNSGKVKKTTEQYLVDAVSVTDAEATITKDLGSGNLDFEVKSVTASKILSVLSA